MSSVDLYVHSDSQGTGKLELVRPFCCKVAESNSVVRDGLSCKGDDCEEVQ